MVQLSPHNNNRGWFPEWGLRAPKNSLLRIVWVIELFRLTTSPLHSNCANQSTTLSVTEGSRLIMTGRSTTFDNYSRSLRLGDCWSESGRNPAPALPASTGAIFEQHPGAGSSSDQTTNEGQAELSRVPSSRANDCGIRGYAHDTQRAGAVVSSDAVRQQNRFIDQLFDLAA
jgi:hypothetical protein